MRWKLTKAAKKQPCRHKWNPELFVGITRKTSAPGAIVAGKTKWMFVLRMHTNSINYLDLQMCSSSKAWQCKHQYVGGCQFIYTLWVFLWWKLLWSPTSWFGNGSTKICNSQSTTSLSCKFTVVLGTFVTWWAKRSRVIGCWWKLFMQFPVQNIILRYIFKYTFLFYGSNWCNKLPNFYQLREPKKPNLKKKEDKPKRY